MLQSLCYKKGMGCFLFWLTHKGFTESQNGLGWKGSSCPKCTPFVSAVSAPLEPDTTVTKACKPLEQKSSHLKADS